MPPKRNRSFPQFSNYSRQNKKQKTTQNESTNEEVLPEESVESLFAKTKKSGLNFDKYDSIQVHVEGKDVPEPIISFNQANLNETVLKNVYKCKYEKPTPIQKYSIPIIQHGRDLLACAQTGSGKTAAFLLPAISKILAILNDEKIQNKNMDENHDDDNDDDDNDDDDDSDDDNEKIDDISSDNDDSNEKKSNNDNENSDDDDDDDDNHSIDDEDDEKKISDLSKNEKQDLRVINFVYPSILVLCPTRELALQISDEARKFCDDTNLNVVALFGGQSKVMQQSKLKEGCDILVATPGRLCEFIGDGLLELSEVKFMIMDEADRMLDSGFADQLQFIVKKGGITKDRQTLLFSATFTKAVQYIGLNYMRDYVHLSIGNVGQVNELITQNVLFVKENDKDKKLVDELKKSNVRTIIFVRTKVKLLMLQELLFSTFVSNDHIQTGEHHQLNEQRGKKVDDGEPNSISSQISNQKPSDPMIDDTSSSSSSSTSSSDNDSDDDSDDDDDDNDSDNNTNSGDEEDENRKNVNGEQKEGEKDRIVQNSYVDTIHGDKSQAERSNVLNRFKNGEFKFLIATDVASRGIDVENVEHVINYDFPNDFETYIHRIGRTGRAGRSGVATTFMNYADYTFAPELYKFLEEGKQIVPEWLKTMSLNQQRSWRKKEVLLVKEPRKQELETFVKIEPSKEDSTSEEGSFSFGESLMKTDEISEANPLKKEMSISLDYTKYDNIITFKFPLNLSIFRSIEADIRCDESGKKEEQEEVDEGMNQKSKEENSNGHCIFIYNLPPNLDMKSFFDVFKKHGRILSKKFVGEASWHSRYCYLYFQSSEEALSAQKEHHVEFQGRKLVVVYLGSDTTMVVDMKTIRIEYLPTSVTEDDLKFHFRKCGKIKNIFLPTIDNYDIKTAYVEFDMAMEAQEAIKQFDGTHLLRSTLRVSLARTKKNRDTLIRTIRVEGYGEQITKDIIRTFFSRAGAIVHLECIKDSLYPYTLIEYIGAKESMRACWLNRMKLGGRNIRVKFATFNLSDLQEMRAIIRIPSLMNEKQNLTLNELLQISNSNQAKNFEHTSDVTRNFLKNEMGINGFEWYAEKKKRKTNKSSTKPSEHH